MNKSVVVIQARLSSTRLPAKVLLPVSGMPLVVLAAKRAANTGRDVLVVTSSEPSDDYLCDVLKSHSINFYRGSLNNTLDRFVKALKNYDDQTIVFRLTADNVFPDGALLDEIEDEFLNSKLKYLCCNGESSGLPYGMSAEVMYLSGLRESLTATSDSHDLEHVTPYIKKLFGEVFFEKYRYLNKGSLRATIDTFDDYLILSKVFQGVSNPVSESSFNLVQALKKLDTSPVSDVAVKNLVLGGAQLGLDYGITNQTGQPDINNAIELIRMAIVNGVEYIDTASEYGNSETVIGKALKHGWDSRVKVITKLSTLSGCPLDADRATVKAFVASSVYKSCRQLGIPNLDCLMLHRAEHLSAWSGAVIEELVSLKTTAVISSLGVSVQSPEELIAVLKHEEFEFIQMPLNILDSRWAEAIKEIERVKKDRCLVIHARSSLLQGLLLSSDRDLWKQANCQSPKELIEWLKFHADDKNRIDLVDLCLSYVRSQNWVDAVVVGMESKEQLIKNIQLFSTPLLQELELKDIDLSRPCLNVEMLNPANWKRA